MSARHFGNSFLHNRLHTDCTEPTNATNAKRGYRWFDRYDRGFAARRDRRAPGLDPLPRNHEHTRAYEGRVIRRRTRALRTCRAATSRRPEQASSWRGRPKTSPCRRVRRTPLPALKLSALRPALSASDQASSGADQASSVVTRASSVADRRSSGLGKAQVRLADASSAPDRASFALSQASGRAVWSRSALDQASSVATQARPEAAAASVPRALRPSMSKQVLGRPPPATAGVPVQATWATSGGNPTDTNLDHLDRCRDGGRERDHAQRPGGAGGLGVGRKSSSVT